MIHLKILVEGPTELNFVQQVLKSHLYKPDVFDVSVLCVETGRKGGFIYRGGMSNYEKAKNHLMMLMEKDQNDQNNDLRFTTMFDLYQLPKDFPEFNAAREINDPYQRVNELENAFGKDINDKRFIPFFQLHEFEAILLSDPTKFNVYFVEKMYETPIKNLEEIAQRFVSPELINKDTGPSKWIIKEIPEYNGRKAQAGPMIAQQIGLETIRKKCPHFNEWITKLETLGR